MIKSIVVRNRRIIDKITEDRGDYFRIVFPTYIAYRYLGFARYEVFYNDFT